MSVRYEGKYGAWIHTLEDGRFIVAVREPEGMSTRNPPRLEVGARRRKIVALGRPIFVRTLDDLVLLGVPTYANSSAAIKAARRVYPWLIERYPWRRCRDATL